MVVHDIGRPQTLQPRNPGIQPNHFDKTPCKLAQGKAPKNNTIIALGEWATIACEADEFRRSPSYLNMARRATSVLPKPTSPQSNLSMGIFLQTMSFSISTRQRSCIVAHNANMRGRKNAPTHKYADVKDKGSEDMKVILYRDRGVSHRDCSVVFGFTRADN